MITEWIVAILAAYLIGSIPTAVWLSRLFFRKDIREHGSGNAGSTNTYRVLGLWPGLVVQVVDILKGVAAAFLPIWLGLVAPADWFLARIPLETAEGQTLCGLAAVLGHIWPVWADFRGGKGMNTLVGMFLAIFPVAALVAIGVFVLILLAFRMVSLASMLATFTLPIFLTFVYVNRDPTDWTLYYISWIIPLLVIYTHRTNIQRIVAGSESKVRLFSR